MKLSREAQPSSIAQTALLLLSIVAASAGTGCARAAASVTPRSAVAARATAGVAALPSSSGAEVRRVPSPAPPRLLAAPPALPQRNAPSGQANGHGASATVASGPRLEGSARRAQVQSIVHRSGVAAACWNDAVAHLPQHRPERVCARVSIDVEGRARVLVEQADDPRLARCIRLRLASQPYGPGGAVDFEASWQFSLNE